MQAAPGLRGRALPGRTGSVGRRDADRAGHTRPADAAVAVRDLVQVLLVVVLGEVERSRREHLGGDLVEAALGQPRAERLAGAGRRLELRVGRRVDRRPVLRADVVALPEALGRVVALPE